MPYEDSSCHCHQCAKQVLARRRTPDHAFHLVLILCTAGIWLIPWLFITIRGGEREWRCWSCGAVLRRD